MSGLYESYLGLPRLQQWEGDHCSNIQNASDGTKFKSFIQEDEQLLFFRKSMCRAQRMVQAGRNYEVDGIQATKFVFEDNALDNGKIDKRNKCFCRQGHCLPTGLIDVTDCYYGFPIALSYPHFLDGDQHLLEKINGLQPNQSLHRSFFMINPLSGLPLKLSVKFQINMALGDISSITECERFSDVVIPTLWFEITMMQLPISLRNRFIFYLNYLRVADCIMYYVFFIGGGLLLLFSILRVSFSLSVNLSSYRISRLSKTYDRNVQKTTQRRRQSNSKLDQGSEKERQHFLL
ncbi:scavenger receptor class B member 1-like isoform X3 [Wyeomyia smithii]|nr:scavenger receptor class B member 1-like isoform X3 [Wyeomyia smithii]